MKNILTFLLVIITIAGFSQDTTVTVGGMSEASVANADSLGNKAPAFYVDTLNNQNISGLKIFKDDLVLDSTLSIGVSVPAASAIIDITSITKGFLPPRMTSTQRDNIITPASGLMIYDNINNKTDFYNGTEWRGLLSGSINTLVVGEIPFATAGHELDGDVGVKWDNTNKIFSATSINSSKLISASGQPIFQLEETDHGGVDDRKWRFQINAGIFKFETLNDAETAFTPRIEIDRSTGAIAFKNGNVTIANQIKIAGGTPTAGYVLQTDANGLATWEAITAGAAGADGAIQFATGGSLNSDVANISFDNSLNVFTLGKTTFGQVAEIGNAIFRNRNVDDFSLKHKLFDDTDIDDLVGFGHNLGGKITIGATLDNTIDFLTGDGVTVPTLKMVIIGNGNVGIGTDFITETPDELTHIAGAVDGIFTGLLIENSQAAAGASLNERAEIKFGFGGNNEVARITVDKLKDYTSGANEDSRIAFWVDDAGTLTEIAHIMPDGLMLMLADPKIRFATTTGGGGSIQYRSLAGSNRAAFLLAGNNVVAVTSRGVDGVVEVRANTGTGGNGGEVIVAEFQDDQITFLSSGGNLGIGATPATSAALDVTSTTGAVLLPRMTTTQRDALTELAGMIIFNTTTTAFEGYDGTSWNAL